MRYTKHTLAIIAALLFGAAAAEVSAQAAPPGAPGAEELLARLDSNESFRTIRYTGRMEIVIGGQTRVKEMTAVAMGSDKALIEFTNPEDRGIRYLKLAKELWMYFPKEQDTVKISGHLLKEGLMGSDVSYEDALESADFRAKYTASVTGSEEVGGRRAWILELKAKVPTASYDRRLMWIDAERYVQLKEEMYAKSGKLLKTSTTLEVRRVGERWYAVSVRMESKLRKDTSTTFTMGKLELDLPLDAKQFSLAALTK